MDNLGIHVSLATLRSWPEYVAARDAFFGVGRVGRFWCRWVRPWLRPARQAELRARFEDAQGILRQEYFEQVLDQAAEEAAGKDCA